MSSAIRFCCSNKSSGTSHRRSYLWYKIYILVLTFLCYASYHLSRKPISVVKSVLHQNCSLIAQQRHIKLLKSNATFCDWKPFDQNNWSTLLGSLEYAYLFSYAFGMFISGHLAERIDLRVYLSFGMVLCGITTVAFGFGFFFNIHSIAFYIIIQIAGGVVQSTGWPSVVTCVGNWYGTGHRGLIMGIWNAHTSVGNILGSVIAGALVTRNWGLSFAVPGLIVATMGVVTYFALIPNPRDVGFADAEGAQYVARKSHRVEKMAVEFEHSHDENGNTIQLVPDDSEVLLSGAELESALDVVVDDERRPISALDALRIPGVVEFALCLFFAKLVSYTFLYWLPNYIAMSTGFAAEASADLSTLFDFGGIVGGIAAGHFSDKSGAHAFTCLVMLVMAAPMLYVYQIFGATSLLINASLLFVCGGLVNGPYALITTAVSADLGTRGRLRSDARALATVTAIIDGTGSMGAALGPLMTGILVQFGWNAVFAMLIGADVAAALLLIRMTTKECTQRHKF